MVFEAKSPGSTSSRPSSAPSFFQNFSFQPFSFTRSPLFPRNPLFPVLRSGPTAVSGASRQKQIPSIQSDGLRAYQTFIARHPDLAITPVSCLAHIRRKFFDARDDHPRITGRILHQIACIYRIEADLREQRAGPLERQKARWLKTRRHYDRLNRLIACLRQRREITPKSLLGQALAYAANQWPHLEPCFADGQIEFDNNLTENAIRPTKLGMKNWTFIGGEHTGWRSAVIYTFVEQIRRHGQDPFAYFEWVFGKLMHDPGLEDLPGLLPAEWLKAQGQPAKASPPRPRSDPQHSSQRCKTSRENARGALLSAYPIF